MPKQLVKGESYRVMVCEMRIGAVAGALWVGLLVCLACARQAPKEQTEQRRAPAAEQPAPPATATVAPTTSSLPEPAPTLDDKELRDETAAPAKPEAAKVEAPKKAKAPSSVRRAKPSPKRSSSGEGLGGIGTTEEERASTRVRSAFDEIETNFTRLGDVLALSTPDCESARRFGERICSLSEEICRLAEASQNTEELALCVDGRRRCAEARRRLSDSCE
jgi:hypothetical protein